MNSVLKDNGKDESCLSVSDKVITVSLGSLRKRNVIYNYTSSLIHLLLQQRNPPPFSLILSLSLPPCPTNSIQMWRSETILFSLAIISRKLFIYFLEIRGREKKQERARKTRFHASAAILITHR